MRTLRIRHRLLIFRTSFTGMRQLSLLLVFVLSGSLVGQVRFGQRAGVGIFKQQFVAEENYDDFVLYRHFGYQSKGITAAFFIDVPITKRLLVGGEVGYSERGYRKETYAFQRDEILRSGYVGLSVLPKYRIGRGPVQMELFAGLDVALRLNLRERYLATYITEPGVWPPHFSRSDFAAGQDYSAVMGARLIAGSGPVKFHLNWRYLYGLSNYFDRVVSFTDAQGVGFGTGRMFNRGMHICIGFSAPLSSKGWENSPRAIE